MLKVEENTDDNNGWYIGESPPQSRVPSPIMFSRALTPQSLASNVACIPGNHSEPYVLLLDNPGLITSDNINNTMKSPNVSRGDLSLRAFTSSSTFNSAIMLKSTEATDVKSKCKNKSSQIKPV